MNDRPWWLHLIQWTLFAIVIFFTAKWMNKDRLKKRANNDKKLRYPRSYLIMSLFSFLFFFAISLVTGFTDLEENPTATWWVTAAFTGISLMSLLVLLDSCLSKYQLIDNGINYRKLLRSNKTLMWSDLKVVRYAPKLKWFRLETKGGEVLRISIGLTGLPEFAISLLSKCPSEAIDPETLKTLIETKNGSPPDLWS